MWGIEIGGEWYKDLMGVLLGYVRYIVFIFNLLDKYIKIECNKMKIKEIKKFIYCLSYDKIFLGYFYFDIWKILLYLI